MAFGAILLCISVFYSVTVILLDVFCSQKEYDYRIICKQFLDSHEEYFIQKKVISPFLLGMKVWKDYSSHSYETYERANESLDRIKRDKTRHFMKTKIVKKINID